MLRAEASMKKVRVVSAPRICSTGSPVVRLGCVLLIAFACAAWAAADDVLTLRISTALTQDNNLFRLSSGANANALIGKDNAQEQIALTTTGITLKLAHSLQQLVINVQQVTSRYQNFGYLNNTANSYSADWRWSVSPRLYGHLNTSRQETSDGFTGEQDFKQLNQHTVTASKIDATYEVDGAWRLFGGASRGTDRNLQNQIGVADSSTSSTEAGVGYDFASGSALAYVARNTNGTYQNRVVPSDDLLDDKFKQIDHELRLRWSIDGKSSADLRTMVIKRSHPNYPQRDYQGVNTAAGLNVDLTGKTSLNLGWSRELSSYQTRTTNFSQLDRLSLGTTWKMSPKTQLRLRHEIARQNYLGTPTGVVLTEANRADATQNTVLSLEWQPYTFVVFTIALQKALRTSNLIGLDYESYLANLSAQFTY